MKKTKIVATMSDFRCTEEFVKNLFDAGMDVVRVNSAHVSEEGATHIVETVHRVNPAIPIMIDTKGPEIRVTTIADEYGNSINFRPGDRVAVRGSDGSDKTTRKVVYMNVPNIVDDIPVGARMLIADGELEIRVVEKTAEELTCEFVVGGAMRSRKSVNVPSVSINLPSVTEKDRRFIEWAVKNDVDFIAHSFVRSARDIKAVQDILDAHGSKIKIISKIENREGLDNIDEIIEASYGIMVARGDLGVELPAEAIPNTQRRIVEKCICAKRPVIIATQMLYSMVKSPRPTRAEVSDVASAIYERVDAVMLSDETAMGDFPVESVETMARIAREIERWKVNGIVLSGGFVSKAPMAVMRGLIPIYTMSYYSPLWLRAFIRYCGPFMIRQFPFSECYFLEDAKKFREALQLPLIYVGGLVSREGIERALDSGFELVQMARALVNDPAFVNKLREGDASTRSGCDHRNYCIARMYSVDMKCCKHCDGLPRRIQEELAKLP